jgi:hypothetical protein
MGEGKQLSMEKKMNEKEIMRKALLDDLNKMYRSFEYTQMVVDSNYQVYSSYKRMYSKIATLLADAKFYYLSATFVLMKDLPEFNKLRLKEHMEANRPPQMNNITPRGIFLTYDLLSGMRKDMLEKVRPYQKYLKPKFAEYFGDCINKINKSLKELDKNYAV